MTACESERVLPSGERVTCWRDAEYHAIHDAVDATGRVWVWASWAAEPRLAEEVIP